MPAAITESYYGSGHTTGGVLILEPYYAGRLEVRRRRRCDRIPLDVARERVRQRWQLWRSSAVPVHLESAEGAHSPPQLAWTFAATRSRCHAGITLQAG
jgi:hypothetical protein